MVGQTIATTCIWQTSKIQYAAQGVYGRGW